MVSNLRRLAADHAALHSKLPPYYLLPPDDGRFTAGDDLSQLCILLTGPPGTPYAQGLWKLHLKLPEDYPNSPPKATFRTRIWHPNVEELTGAVCVDTLKRDWQSKLTLRDVLITISCLLIHPNPDSALNSSAGNLLREEYNEFAHQAELMTSIHAAVPSDIQAAVNEAKHRGEDPESMRRGADVPSQRPRKQQRTQSSSSSGSRQSNRPEYLPQPPRDIPQPQPILEDDQMEISDDENDNPASASKENDPSLSPTPVHLAPPSIRPRKNAFGKRPLSVLSIPYSEDPDTDMMLVDSDSENEKDAGPSPSNNLSFSSSDKNIAANTSVPNFSRPSLKFAPRTPQRKNPRLATTYRGNTPMRLREEVQIYEDVPDRTLTDASRRFGGDSKENSESIGPCGLQETRGFPSGKVVHAGNPISMQTGTAHGVTPLAPQNRSPLKNTKKYVGSRKGLGMKTKPRIGVRRL